MDVRTVRAFLSNGSELGLLRVSGKWAKTPHSLETRKLINKYLRSEKRQFFLASNDYIQALRDHLSTSKSKGDKNWYAHEQRYQQQMEKTLQETGTDVEGEVKDVSDTEGYQVETMSNNILVISREEVNIDVLKDGWDEFFKPMSF